MVDDDITKTNTLTLELLHNMDAYWRAANYLSVGQIFLSDNPLLKRPLTLADVKHMLLGQWGTTPGQNFIYVHLNRLIKEYDLDMIYVSGPGHGGPAVEGNTYLDSTYSEIHPNVTRDEHGLEQFLEPRGVHGADLAVTDAALAIADESDPNRIESARCANDRHPVLRLASPRRSAPALAE